MSSECCNAFHMPLLGEKMVDISVTSTDGPINLPEDMKGSWFVLFSHPADFTPVCTTEFVAFQKRKAEFDALKCKLIGLSIDQVFAHIKWLQWIKDNLNIEITFPVIAGTETIASQLGMLHPGKGSNTVRAVFIIDPNGIVRLVLYYPQEVGRNIDEVIRAVKALQIADSQGPTPANWPNNELISNQVIMPPPTSKKEAEKRLKAKDCQCYDWWFCHKPLKK